MSASFSPVESQPTSASPDDAPAPSSGGREAPHEVMPVARIGDARFGDEGAGLPSAPFEHQAGGSLLDVQPSGKGAVGAGGAHDMLGIRPRHAPQQPCARRIASEALLMGFGNGHQVDQ